MAEVSVLKHEGQGRARLMVLKKKDEFRLKVKFSVVLKRAKGGK